MTLDRSRVSRYLQRCQFEDLFMEELGWDAAGAPPLTVHVEGTSYTLRPIAQKRGVMALEARFEQIPPSTLRRKIESQVVTRYRQHFIIFVEEERNRVFLKNSVSQDSVSLTGRQIWQWVLREPGRTLSRSHEYLPSQSGESLIQKLSHIAFSLEQEEGLTHVDVVGSVWAAFDVERATRTFFAEFKKQRDCFQKFLAGIPDEDLESWYASVMLNRIMFIYFIQGKSFLDNDTDYLRTHLEKSRRRGPDLYYREFLCPLFFEGFAQPESRRTAAQRQQLGRIPYLNGGIFQQHQVELLHGQRIQIPDRAFEQLYDFFDRYHWHLDDRPLRNDDEINPDVLGYIFEQYINQKQMGAYYTKEDITDYISKNTILPFLFDQVQKECPAAFRGEGSIWTLLTENPNRYIYPTVQQGMDHPLPVEIEAGVADVSERGAWNTPTPAPYALPTEIWRETVTRRLHCAQVRARLTAGEVTAINDLITLNLDIAQFAQDVIEGSDSPELVRAFWKALNRVSVLDPTCGSGAFLFAALNVLKPLYEACLDRMESFVAAAPGERKFADFRETLAGTARHPNRDYFVLKSIVVNNLYGVDIMEEATEIAKLRLFLKLVAQVDDVKRLEPLPDIDFNIRAGNTLVGFASYDEMEEVVRGGRLLLLPEDEDLLAEIRQQAEDADRLFSRFRQMQTGDESQAWTEDYVETKEKLRRRLGELNDRLNRLLAQQYGVDPDKLEYEAWLKSHQPFHWFVEFYGILKDGGFGVTTGNPPYVEYTKVKQDYQLLAYDTLKCGNLFAFVLERCTKLTNPDGYLGFIIPVSGFATDRMTDFQKLILQRCEQVWTSHFGVRPAKLFTGAEQRLTILLGKYGHIYGRSVKSVSPTWTSKFHRWYVDEREQLLSTLRYVNIGELVSSGIFPKVSTPLELSIFSKMNQIALAFAYDGQSTAVLYWHRIPQYFVKAVDYVPYFWNNRDGIKKSEDYKLFSLRNPLDKETIVASVNSSLFYWYWFTNSDGYHCGKKEILKFPLEITNMDGFVKSRLIDLAGKLMLNYQANTVRRKRSQRTTEVEYDEFQPALAKPIMDEIDTVLAQHYGFTDEELDYILNYDIKYRMGDELFSEDDEEE